MVIEKSASAIQRFNAVTVEPTRSPTTTRFKFPGTFILKTTIGILLSMQSEIAVESITESPFCSTSRYVMRLEHFRRLHLFRIGVVNAVHARGLQNHLRLDFHGAQRRRSVRGKIGIACAAGEDHHAFLFQVPRRAAPDERLRHLVHFDRAHQPRVAAGLFERVLHRQAVDHRREHAHVIAGGAIDRETVLARAAKNISAADDKRHFHAEIVHFLHFARDALNRFRVDAESVRTRKRFAGKLHDNAAGRRASSRLLPLRVSFVDFSSRPDGPLSRGHSSRESAARDGCRRAEIQRAKSHEPTLISRKCRAYGFAAGTDASGSSDPADAAQRHPSRRP